MLPLWTFEALLNSSKITSRSGGEGQRSDGPLPRVNRSLQDSEKRKTLML